MDEHEIAYYAVRGTNNIEDVSKVEEMIKELVEQRLETRQHEPIVKRHYEVERRQYDHWDRVHYGSEDINNGRLMAYWENLEDAKEVYNHYLEFQPEYDFRIIEVQRRVTA